jgi:hypothetical protein
VQRTRHPTCGEHRDALPLIAVADRKSFLLRVDPAVMMALERWAGDELRSLNGQIEYLLRLTLQKEGRLPPPDGRPKGREEGKRG